MATVRSIVDIDVKSEAFQEFQKRFEAYQKALQAMPADWAKVSGAAASAAQASSKGAQGMAEAMVAMTAALSAAVRHQGELSRGAGTADRMFKGVARTTGEILRNVTDVTFQLVKWGAFGGILGIAGGGFGAGALAGAGADIRRTSNSYGVSPGQLRAARAIYGPQLDADALLSNIASAQADPAKRFSFSALGITGAKAMGSPGDLLPDVIAGVVEKFKQYGGNTAGFNALGLGNFMDMNTARELSRLPAGELRKEAAQYASESRRLGIPDATLETMKALNQSFSVAKDRIETVLINGLGRLSTPLENLSSSIVKALETFMNNPNMGHYIDQFGKGIENVANYLSSAGFQQDITDFVAGVHKLAHPLDTARNAPIPFTGGTSLTNVGTFWGGKAADLADWLANPNTGISGATMAGFKLGMAQVKWNHGQYISLMEKSHGLPAGMLDRVWATESSRGARGGVNPSTGAFGDFQFIPSTAKQYGITSGSSWNDQADAAARKLSDLLHEYHGDASQAIAAYFGGDRAVNAAIRKPGNWQDHLGPKTAAYLQKTGPVAGASTGITVVVNNQTGGDANVIASQLVH